MKTDQCEQVSGPIRFARSFPECMVSVDLIVPMGIISRYLPFCITFMTALGHILPLDLKNMQRFLAVSNYIDFDDPEIHFLALNLAGRAGSESDLVRICFEFVRDEIRHSSDFRLNPVTCKASDVLKHRTGYCYAKNHLLAALLRANGIPAGLCYQRLSVGDGGAPYCLHGLNAVYLEEFGWHRIDARGNKPGVNAQFKPPEEFPAFRIRDSLERDLPEIWAEPLVSVVEVLEHAETYEQVLANLPDVELPVPPEPRK